MSPYTSLAVLLIIAAVGFVDADQKSFDCPMRQMALKYAMKVQPFRTRENFQQIADALNGSPEAQNCKVTVPTDFVGGNRVASFPIPDGETFYVDAVRGRDSNPGTINAPFQTIQKAIEAPSSYSGAVIVLRKGTFYLDSTITLTTKYNGLTIQNYPNEEAWISGAKLIKPDWKPYKVSPKKSVVLESNQNNVWDEAKSHANTSTIIYLGSFDTTEQCQAACLAWSMCKSFTFHTPALTTEWRRQCFGRSDSVWNPHGESGINSGRITGGENIYVTTLSDIANVQGLRINTKRSIRARYPNADPELGFGSSLKANSWLKPTLPTNPKQSVFPPTPFRNSSDSFQRYQLGIGGPCEDFTPPAGYWCGTNTSGGGHFTYRIPSGMVADKSKLPNSPYKNAIGAVVQAWRPAHWASWMFEVGSYEASSGTFKFSKGGFQGARGNDNGDEFYIENVFEELDSENEWFFDTQTKMLYLWYNGTGMPPSDTLFEVTQVKTLFEFKGTQSSPVKSIVMRGVGFKDTVYTYLDPHGMPSGGDWGLQRFGALFFEGTEKCEVDSCVFSRLDGNAIMISGYNRNTTIQRNEFKWIGDTAIASWGDAKGTLYNMGWDGTGGEQPRFNTIVNNLVHELGIWEKQSSFYFQAKTCQTLLDGNIFYNGPRAGINFNDGFGGGSKLTSNILFNTCRESGDHGPFNSWDRQVYVTKVNSGVPSTIKAYDEITKNFIIANYNSQEAIDNDDGSCYYKTHDNFFAYSGNGMKNDFGGHDNHHYNNVYGYIGKGFSISSQLEGHEDYFYNNYLVMTKDGDYGNPKCTPPGKTVVHDNKVFTPNGVVNECGMSLEDWQKKGGDPGTTAAKTPSDAELLAQISKTLGV